MDLSSKNNSMWNDLFENEALNDSILRPDNQTDLDSVVSTISIEIYLTKAIVNCTILPLLAVVGILGNISTIIVFSKKKKKNSSNYFIICLAVSDVLVLLFRSVANIYLIGHFYFNEKMRYVRPSSLFWIVLSYAPQRSGCLFILAIVVERFTAVWFPLKLKRAWTKTTAHVIIVAIAVLILAEMIGTVDLLLFSLNERVPEQGLVSAGAESLRYLRAKSPFIKTWSFTLCCILDLVPNPAIMIFNVLIIIGIRRSLVIRRKMTTSTQEQNNRELTKTRMLLGMSLLFTILCSPYYVYVYLMFFDAIRSTDLPVVMYELFKLSNLLNSAINIVVYGINDPALRGKYINLWRCRS